MRDKIIGVLAVAAFLAQTASADPYPVTVPRDNNDRAPDIYQAINAVLGTSYANNAAVQGLRMEKDIWTMGSQDDVVLIGMTASYTNELGVYTGLADGSGKVSVITFGNHFGFLGTGTASDPFQKAAKVNLAAGQQFGWYLNANLQQYYYSNPTLNATNDAGWDHLMTYDLSSANGKHIWMKDGSGATVQYVLNNACLLAWEDLNICGGGSDNDYDDMMYVFGSVSKVPEPSSLALVLLGLGTCVAALRRKVR